MKVINLHGVVGVQIDPKEFANELDNTTGDILLDLNSGGGYIAAGLSILNKIRSYENGRIIARVSYAASMMTQIALAADEVQVYNTAIFMIHNAQGVAIGDYREMEKRKNMLRSLTNMLAKTYIDKTGKPAKKIHQMMDDETYLYGEEIVKEGFADNLIEAEEETTRDEAIAYAHMQLEEVNKAIANEDLTTEQLLACVGDCRDAQVFFGYNDEQSRGGASSDASNSSENKEKSMNLSQLRAEHPELYAEAVAVGVNQERERVTAHITMGEASGDMALAIKCINEGSEMSATLNAQYMAAHMKRTESDDRNKENVPDVNTPNNGDEGDGDKAMAEAVAELLGVDHE